jgi:hypothetical protein
MGGLGCTGSAIALSPIKDIRDAGPENANAHNGEQDQEEGVPTQGVEHYEAYAENRSYPEGRQVKCTDAVANDLDDKDSQSQEQKASQPG